MAHQDDTGPLIDPRDIAAALGLLTRLPVPVNTDHATARGAKAAWAYPIAGLCVAVLACTVAQISLALNMPAAFAAAFALATFVITTGAMHEDGLADCADGFWGGWDAENRLRIMKDSHIGAYGTIALILSIGLRWGAITALIGSGVLWPALITIAMLSRAAMVPVMAFVPNARDTGLSRAVGRPSTMAATVAEVLAILAALVVLQWIGFASVIVTALAALACTAIARAKIAGQTGDVLGATQQIVEIACLITVVTLLQ